MYNDRYKTYTEYLDARIVALKQTAFPMPGRNGRGMDVLEAATMRRYIAHEGYGLGGPLDDVTADLRAAPIGCNCAGCIDKCMGNIDAAIVAGDKPGYKIGRTARCKRCDYWSLRAYNELDGLCDECYLLGNLKPAESDPSVSAPCRRCGVPSFWATLQADGLCRDCEVARG